jgi:hypothetical protein
MFVARAPIYFHWKDDLSCNSCINASSVFFLFLCTMSLDGTGFIVYTDAAEAETI